MFSPTFRPFSLEEGEVLVRVARSAVRARFDGGTFSLNRDLLRDRKFGVFVTIERIIVSGNRKRREVRGSRGTVRPIRDVIHDVALAATHAAFKDERAGRFVPAELGKVVFEVTLVSPTRPVSLDELPSVFVPGYHGVLAGSEVLLPQTVVEHRLVGRSLVARLCSGGCPEHVELFETQIFYELYPEGTVIERELWKCRDILGAAAHP